MRFQVVALGSLALDCGVMDILREFLESSTIHGVAHISTSKVNIFHILLHWTPLLELDNALDPDHDQK